MQAIPVQKPKLIGNQKGLTLIELLAVIIVLGIIMAIAVPSVAGVIERSKVQADRGSWYVIKEAALRYALVTNAANGATVTVVDLATQGYLNAKPTPQSNRITDFHTVKITLAGNTYSVDVYESADTTQPAISETDFQ